MKELEVVGELKESSLAASVLTPEILERYQRNQGYVYLIHAAGTNRYKIGRTVNPIVRLGQLQKQSPYPLRIVESFWSPDAIADEKALHSEFFESRVLGEWFELYQLTPEEFGVTLRSKEKKDLGEELFKKYHSSSEHVKKHFLFKRPETTFLAQQLALRMAERMMLEVDGIKNEVLPETRENIFEWLLRATVHYFYEMLAPRQSIKDVVRICNFLEENFIRSINLAMLISFCGRNPETIAIQVAINAVLISFSEALKES